VLREHDASSIRRKFRYGERRVFAALLFAAMGLPALHGRLLLVCCAFGCSSMPNVPSSAEDFVCPELAGDADPLRIPFTEDTAADGRIRAFMAASRGLYDAVVEMNGLAVDACARMTRDVSPRTPLDTSTLSTACAPILSTVRRLRAAGVDIRVAISDSHCQADTDRADQCVSACGAGGADCQALCRSTGAIYAHCSLPSVTVWMSSAISEAVALAATLERNLPSVLYAEMALGRRLFDHAGALVQVAHRLPRDVRATDPHAVACVGLAALVIGRSAKRLDDVVSASAVLTTSWQSSIARGDQAMP
jgi:hypothetical protein